MASVWSSVEGVVVMGFGFLLLFSSLSLFLLLRKRRSLQKLTLPPCPSPCWPLIDHLFLFAKIFKNSYLLQNLSKELGPIIRLHLGAVDAIFITSASVAHEALVLKGALFATRPLLQSRALFTSNFHGISSAPYGPYWRHLRRNLVNCMLSPASALSFKPVRDQVLSSLISRFSQACASPIAVPVSDNCRFSMFQLLLTMCFGVNFPDDVVSQVSDMIEKVLRFSLGFFSDSYPYLAIVDWRRRRRAQHVRQMQVDLFQSLIKQHMEMQKLGEVISGNYLETLFRMEQESRGEIQLSGSDLVTLCTEFLVGGIDTTITCMEWAFAHLVEQQHIQAKLYHEIENMVEKGRPIAEDDLAGLPFLQAIVKETLRLHPPGHFTLPHAVSKPCELAGYSIPKHAIVNFHIPSISRDPNVWEDPLEYRPERMLARDVDITCTKHMIMLPFSAGRRVCPGAGLAMMHLELFIGRLVQEFEWMTEIPGKSLDMSEETKFTVVMKHPLKAQIKRRDRFLHG